MHPRFFLAAVLFACLASSAAADDWQWVTADTAPASWIGFRSSMDPTGRIHVVSVAPTDEPDGTFVQQIGVDGAIDWSRPLPERLSQLASGLRYDTSGNLCWLDRELTAIRLRCFSTVDGSDTRDRRYPVAGALWLNLRFFSDGSALAAFPMPCGNGNCPTLLKLDSNLDASTTRTFPPGPTTLSIKSDGTVTASDAGETNRYRLDGTMWATTFRLLDHDTGYVTTDESGIVALLTDPHSSNLPPRTLLSLDAAGNERWRAPLYVPPPNEFEEPYAWQADGTHLLLRGNATSLEAFSPETGERLWRRDQVPGLINVYSEAASAQALLLVKPDVTHLHLHVLNAANGNYGSPRELPVTPFGGLATWAVDENRDLRVVTIEIGTGSGSGYPPRHYRVYSLADAFRAVELLRDSFE